MSGDRLTLAVAWSRGLTSFRREQPHWNGKTLSTHRIATVASSTIVCGHVYTPRGVDSYADTRDGLLGSAISSFKHASPVPYRIPCSFNQDPVRSRASTYAKDEAHTFPLSTEVHVCEHLLPSPQDM